MGLGIVSVFNRIGGALSPLVVNLNNVSHNSHFLVFGIFGSIAGSLSVLLPETLGCPLPELPEDVGRQIIHSEKTVRHGDKQLLLGEDDLVEEATNDV